MGKVRNLLPFIWHELLSHFSIPAFQSLAHSSGAFCLSSHRSPPNTGRVHRCAKSHHARNCCASRKVILLKKLVSKAPAKPPPISLTPGQSHWRHWSSGPRQRLVVAITLPGSLAAALLQQLDTSRRPPLHPPHELAVDETPRQGAARSTCKVKPAPPANRTTRPTRDKIG